MRHSTRVLTMAAVFVLATGCKKSSSSADGGPYIPSQHNQPNQLKAGAGETNIDLPVGTPTAGYAQSPVIGFIPPTDDPGSPYADIFPATRGLYSPPHAKVIVFDNRDSDTDPDHSRLVFAKIDAVGVTDILGERVIQLAQQELNEDISDELILNGSHTHCAGCRFSRESMVPDIISPQEYPPNYLNALAHGFDTYSQELTDDVANAIVGALKQALANLRPAKFGYASADNMYADNDRRCENQHLYGMDNVNHRVMVMRVDDAATGDPIAVAYNYAVHGTMCNDDNRNLGVDVPGHSEYMVEEQFQTPVVAMFIQGDAADVSPNGRGNADSQGDQAAGYSIAQTVMQAYDTIQTTSVLPLQVHMRWSPVSYDILNYKPGEFYKDGAILCFEVTGDFQCPPGGTYCYSNGEVSSPCTSVLQDGLCLAPAVPGGGKYFTRFATARIGDLALVSMPGESSTQLGKEIIAGGLKSTYPYKDLMVVGYALDHMGYLMVDEDWLSGGYEPTITFWGWKFARYAEAQGLDLLQEMTTGVASAKLPVTVANMQPDQYTRIQPSDSMPAPAIFQDAPSMLPRMSAVEVKFYGGDPGWGQPVVRLQSQGSDGTFSDVMVNGWIPVGNDHGYYMATFYSGTPTYKADPTATVRQHSWTVHYEPPPSLPLGTYRLSITGTASASGVSAPYTLNSATFQVVPATNLTVTGQLVASTTDSGMLVFDGILQYDQQPPIYAPASSPSPDWQLGNFLLYNPQFGGGFSPAVPGSTIPAASLTFNTMAEQSITLAYQTPAVDPGAINYAPGAGPGLHAEFASIGSGMYELDVPSMADQYGNTSAAASFMLSVQ